MITCGRGSRWESTTDIIGEEQNVTMQQIGSSVEQPIRQSQGLAVRLTNRFTNNADWQFGWATRSAITGIGSSVGQPIRQSQGLAVRLSNPFGNHRDWQFS